MRTTPRFGILHFSALGGVLPGLVAVVLWSLAPVLANLAQRMPPLQLTALCLLVAAVTTWPVGRLVTRQQGLVAAVGMRVWALAPLLVIGALGFYFLALRLAPPAEAALVTYTWPVLFVIAAELAHARRVRLPSIAGAALAFAGAGLVLMPAQGVSGDIPWLGYGSAFASGTCWASFSLLARQQPVPLAGLMPRLFGIGAAVAGLGHGVFEVSMWPVPFDMAVSIALIGLGPYGLAFLAWDMALRRGRSATVGTLAYAVPVLSAVLLVATGMATADWRLPVAAFGVVLGCAIAGRPPRSARAESAPAK